MARLEVQLEADIKGLITKLNSAQKELKDTGKVSLKTGKQLDKLGITATKGGKKIQANATPAVQEFSRVIQDAPFGIQGVANNIQQLTAQFGNLSKKTGGAKSALKAMVGSLAGPAGVLLAVSVVTSLLVEFGDELFSSSNKAKQLRKSQDELTESLEDYEITLDAVNRTRLEGEKNATKELTTLRLLTGQVNNTNLSNKERLDALNELRRIYPNYLKDMTDEKALTGGLKGVYDELTTSILKRAKATAATNLIVKNSETLLTLESQLAAEKENLAKREADLAKAQQTSANVRTGVNTSIQRATLALQQQQNVVDDLTGSIQKLQLTNIDLEGSFDANSLINPEKILSKKQVGKITADMVGRFKTISSNLQSVGIVPIKIDEQGIQGELQKANELYQTGFSDLVNTTNLLTDSIGSSFNALAGQITNSLATGNAIVDAFIGSLVNSLTQLLAQLIATSIAEKTIAQTKISTEQGKSNANAVTIASNAAAALGPLGAVAFPGILAAQLAIVNSAFAGIRAFATGGFSGDNNLIRVNGDEAILTSRDQLELANFMRNNRLEKIAASKVGRNDVSSTEIVGVLRGKDIQLVNKRASRTMRNVYSS